MTDNYEIKNDEIQSTLKRLGDLIGGTLPEGWVFNLLIASVGEKGATFYISNGERGSMIELLEEHTQRMKEAK